jgi:hypothetical protein
MILAPLLLFAVAKTINNVLLPQRRKREMTLQLCAPRSVNKDELCFSYYVKTRNGRPSRVGFARVIDISESGLCMEISPFDSDLFVEWHDSQPGFNNDIELQIFCRSHPSNIFVEGSVKWFKQKSELVASSDRMHLCAGVVFILHDDEQKAQIAELLERTNSDTTRCSECEALVSVTTAFCYNCGAKLVTRRDIFKRIVRCLLENGKEALEAT